MKSHVSMEQHACLVCGRAFDTGGILLHKRLAQTLDPTTVTGWGLCPEDQERFDNRYIALVAVDPSKTPPGSTAKPDEVYRTGEVAHIRRSVFNQLFDVPAPEGPLCFVEPGVIAKLKELMDRGEKP